MWDIWDADHEGTLSEQEFKRAMRLLGLKVSAAEWSQLLKLFDKDGDGVFDKEELMAIIQAPIEASGSDGAPESKWLVTKATQRALGIIKYQSVQTVIYLAFVIIFQMLTFSLRLKARACPQSARACEQMAL
jgi:hypothetical protein